MKEYIAFDSHKQYTLAEREDARTGRARPCHIEHRPGAIRAYLAGCRKGTAVARHLSEAAWHVLVKKEAYVERGSGQTRKA